MFGLLNINKPAGYTSRDVVNRVQRSVRPHRCGHAGTLDPLATGVLVVGLGAATRLVEYVQRMPKRYLGTFLLGRQSDTEDITGAVVELEAPLVPSRAAIENCLPRFLGQIQQRPPAYSALKIAGERAYALARQGQEVKLAARPITVYGMCIVRYEYPELVLDIQCGSGTYIRSLGRDIAIELGTAAVMSALERTKIGPFQVDTAVTFDELTPESIEHLLLPPRLAVECLPQVVLSPAELQEVSHGRLVRHRAGFPTEASEVAAITPDNKLVAVLNQRSPGSWRPAKNFSRQV